jgi:hypothetical protein
LKYAIVILIIVAVFAQSFTRSILIADYLVNIETYQKNCENKAKPMLHCNGKCQMFKKIKKQEGNNQNSMPIPKFNQEELVLSSKSFFPSIEQAILLNQLVYSYYKGTNPSNYQGSIFHPPGV